MIEMSKENQKFISAFLTRLEKEIIQGPIDKLKNKTKINKFYENDLNALIKILKQNRILPKTISFGNERYEILKKAFEDVMSKLTPLMAKISKTDTLIDQIIYKLYGLAKEEIKRIEESLGKFTNANG